MSDNFLHNRYGQGTRVGVTRGSSTRRRDDYRLAAGSPGIDAGTSAFGAPRRDRAGAARRDDRAVPEPRVGAAATSSTWAPTSGRDADAVTRPRLLLTVHTGERGGASLMALEEARFLARTHDLVIAVGPGPLRARSPRTATVVAGPPSLPLWTDAPGAWLKRSARTAQHAVRLARVIRRERIDLVLVNSTVSLAPGARRAASRACRCSCTRATRRSRGSRRSSCACTHCSPTRSSRSPR